MKNLNFADMEVRVAAQLEGPVVDIYRGFAAEVAGCAPEMITEAQRKAAKQAMLGRAYGMEVFHLDELRREE